MRRALPPFLYAEHRRRRTCVPGLISPYDLAPVDAPVPDAAGLPDPETGEPAGNDRSGSDGTADFDAVRELVLRAHPDVVPDLVTGDSIADLIASVEPARAAYARLADAIAQARPTGAPVPAGGGAPITIDPDRMPAAEKIRRGLASSISKKG